VTVALFDHFPGLRGRVPWAELGDWPTRIDAREVLGRTVWIKREDLAHPRYGGNKIRTLEAWLGAAAARGASRIWAMGAYGSNHAIATLLHAERAGLAAGAIVFPQPYSACAAENAGAMIASGAPIIRLRSVVEVPFVGGWLAWRRPGEVVMPPGGATPVGTFGALSAALELAGQIRDGVAPAPRRIVVAVGSTCTTAGLLAGTEVAAALGLWPGELPIIHAVRVVPWPVTARWRIAALAARTLGRLAALTGRPLEVPAGKLAARLVVDGSQLGGGYGRPTAAGAEAARVLAHPDGPRLDAVYAGKAAAGMLALHGRGEGPLLLWASKSATVMTGPTAEALAAGPVGLVRWMCK
jgi:D-cysteine desulfhydrase